jgi:2-keto-3-deoxy-L-rhamnonate aldolase RhmA
MPLVPNNTRRKMQAGEVALGFGVHHLRSAAAPVLAAATGHDWLFIDNEHGAFSVHEIAQLCIASLPTGVTPLVRVCSNAIDEATRALDNGALGIVMPHVDTAKEARRIAEAFRYPPRGRRSWGGPPAIYGYQPPAMAEAQKAINDEILTVVMLEVRRRSRMPAISRASMASTYCSSAPRICRRSWASPARWVIRK